MATRGTCRRYWAGLACVSISAIILAACSGGGGDGSNPLSPGRGSESPTDVGGDATTPTTAPSPTPEPTTYTVQAGDTLSEIAERFNVTVEALAAANGITDPNSVALGVVLTIPAPSAQPAETPEEESGAS